MQPSLTGPARKEKDGFALSGVVYSAKESYCLINGLVLKVGERVGNATVESIAADQVILDINGKKLTIPVEKN